METTENNYVVSYKSLRRAIGILGMSLPFILFFGTLLMERWKLFSNEHFIKQFSDCKTTYTFGCALKASISHYYYTGMGVVFVGVLFSFALILFTYKGHPKQAGEKGLSDNALANIAAIFAIIVVLLPTSNDNCIDDNVHVFVSSTIIGKIHLLSAAIFFGVLAYMSACRFTKSSSSKEELKSESKKAKRARNNIYIICGIGMFLCMFIIFISFLIEDVFHHELNLPYLTFVMEAIALLLFGYSWLIKGDTFWKDE
jgi:uncharacterized membrane protein